MLNQQSQFNGNVLIINEGQEILKKSYGFSNRETKEKLNENSVFELASLSKQFTAAGIILLKQEGKLKYTDKVSDILPELEFCENVTIKNLLNHSSGIPEYLGIMINNWDKKIIATNKNVIEVLSNKVDRLKFIPNSKFNYSNSNYVILASIIERISQKSYSDFMMDYIFKPLNMQNTSIVNRHYKPKKINNYAYGYVQGENQNIVLPDTLEYLKYVIFLDGIVGDGMVNSTTNDLKKWDQALRNHSLITEKELDFVTKLDTFNNGKINTYSFGWKIKQGEEDIKMSHSGSWPGYVTYISRDLKNRNLIIILQNFDEIVLPIKSIEEILKEKPLTEKYKKEIKLSNTNLEKYVGEYEDTEDSNSITNFTLGENAIIYNSTNNRWNMPFYPDTEKTFFSKAPRMNLGFEFIEENGLMKLVFLQNGSKIGTSIKK